MNKKKGQMARRLVLYCIGLLTLAAVWAMVSKTVALYYDRTLDLSDVLTFIGAAFGGELLLLLVKRVAAKPTTTEEDESDEVE
jgi:hypothetical protein